MLSKECGAISSVEYEPQKSRLTGEHVFEQSTPTREKSAVEAPRPGEPPLGSLTPEEQKWLVNAFAILKRIYEKCIAGRRGDSAYCIFHAGNVVYVQFLASWDTDQLVCEAVSAKSDPRIASILQAVEINVLSKLGFNEPDISPNYSQTINIKCVDESRLCRPTWVSRSKRSLSGGRLRGGDVQFRIVPVPVEIGAAETPADQVPACDQPHSG